MATGATTNFSLPYPLSSDPVAVHTDMQALANAVDAKLVTATAGLNAHENVRVATTVALTGTYTAGTATSDGGTGNGATFVYVAATYPTIDGVTLVAGDRILLKDQASGIQNGLYSVTTVSTNITLTRASDANNTVAGEVAPGDFVFVSAGTANINTGWVMNTVGTNADKSIKIGTDSLTWTLFSSPGSLNSSADVTNATRYLTFTASAAGTLYNYTGAELTYNPSTGILTTKANIQTPNPASTVASNALIAQSGDTTSAASGNVTVRSGNATTSGNSGSLTLTTGTSAATSGALTIGTGNGTTAAGNITIDNGTGGTSTITIGGTNSSGVTIGRNSGTTTIAAPTVTLSNATALNINGATSVGISTTAATAALFNTTATTLNMGGAATAINIGATTGTATIANPTITLSNATTLNINGANPTIATSQTTGTAAILNTGFTGGINIGGASTGALTIGGTSATSTVAIASTLKPRTGTATTGQVPIIFTSGTNLTTQAGGAVEYDGTNLYVTPNSAATNTTNGGRGFIDSSMFTIIGATANSLNATATTAQNIFPTGQGTLGVAGATTYLVDALIMFTNGATAHNTTFSFAGTATWTSSALDLTWTTSAANATGTAFNSAYATATTVAPTYTILSATTTTAGIIKVRGILRINAGGTLIPSITFSAATGATPTILSGSYMRLTPAGSNTVTAIGAWA